MTLSGLLSLVKFEHTLFALPLALTGGVLAAEGIPPLRVLGLMAIAFTAARVSAMAFNRLADRHLDALNPRTARREIPAGKVSAGQAGRLTALSAAVFVASSWLINPLCGKLAPAALLILLGYSYTKRWTVFCHMILGVALGMAPVGGWLAVKGSFGVPPLILAGGVVLWTASFDVLYACQDVEFDRSLGLFSLPAHLGLGRALRLSAWGHGAAWLLFLMTGLSAGLSWPFFLLVLVPGILLCWEHRLVRPEDLSKLDLAFFRANAMVSVSLLMAVSAGVAF